MTYARLTTLGTAPGRREDLVAHLTRRSDVLSSLGCLLYEVGVDDDSPDTVFVMELWTSASAHRSSLQEAEVRESIEQARPLTAGSFGSTAFTVAGSPLRS